MKAARKKWMTGLAALTLVLAFVCVQGVAVAAASDVSLSKSSIQEMQTCLKTLGYYTGSVSGELDAATKSAVKAFQKANGITASGNPDARTLAAVVRKDAVPKTITLSKSGVKKLQQYLKTLRYYSASISGKLDTKTKSALKDFQKANGLAPTGTANQLTLNAVSSKDAVPKKAPLSKSDIQKLQRSLKTLGYYSGSITGKADSKTKSALKVFQEANGLSVTGAPDQATLDALSRKNAVTYTQYVDRLSDEQCKPGGKGAYVLQLKKKLYTLKYYSGVKNDAYDGDTQGAVKLFQTYNQLPVTGIANKATRDKLYGKSAISKTDYEKSLVKQLKYGDKGEPVKMVQRQLAELGYYTGTITGKFDKPLQSAVALFQTANGIKATGKACTTTRKKLNNGTGITKAVYDEKLKTMALKPKDTGTAVKLMQTRLKELGYYTKTVNSKYDDNTKAAVKKFQSYNGLVANGIASAETRALMNSAKALTVEDVEGPKTLKSGNTGEDVKNLQRRLKELGYYTGAIDGKYSSTVVKAVKEFQKANGFQESGTAYAAERKVMNSDKALTKAQYLEKLRLANVEIVIAEALKQLGKPYVWGTSGPDTFDCTGLTCYAFGKVGIRLRRSAYDQGYNDGKKIKNLSEVRRGDIVIFDTLDNGKDKLADHAGIYLGDGTFIHASSGGGKVMISPIKTGYYNRVFSWGLDVW